NAHLSFRTGQNNLYSVSEITFNSQEIFNDTIVASATTQFDFELPLANLKNSNTLEISSVYGTADQHRYAYTSLLYPRDWDFDGAGMKIFKQLKSTERRKANIINVKNPGSGVVLYDPKNKLRYSTSSSNGIVTIITNPVSEITDYVLASEVGGTTILDKVSLFVPKKFEDFGQDYIILTNRVLHDQGEDFVQEYADYRSSVDGGNHTVSIIDVQDVYNQFGFGIDRHFLAIKNMTNFIKNTWQKSKFLFIIGKGLEYPYFRSKEDVINHINKEFFIPTYGYSGSDVYLTSENQSIKTLLAIGRLAATNPDDIKNYLNKVIAYEAAINNPQSVDEKYWQKRVLHLGGGANDSEQFQIKTGLESMASIISDTIWGLEVHPFYKNSGSAVSYAVNEEIKSLFELGVGIINFFGHSATTTWDFSLENPRDYNNYGKYPFINSFGCYSGNLHSTAKGISEAFVLEKDKGSICFFASTSTAFIGDLSNYGVQFFKKLSDQWRYHSYGEVIQAVQKESQGLSYNLLSQLTLHGDPSIKPYFPYGPDYTFDPSSFSTEPKSIGSNDEDAIVEFDIANLGSFIQDSIDLTFYHILPSGRVADTIVIKIPGIANKYHVSVPIKKYNEESIGKNKLLGYIDLKNNIKEVPNPEAENNNSIVIEGQEGFEFFVSDNFAQIVYPPNFAMINTKDHFVLKASTISVPLLNSMYVFEIDTTAYFNSTLKESTTVESKGGLLTYSPKMALVDGRVYYWRVSPQKTAETDYKWSNASFAYLPQEEEGW
ncbi:MAG: hypothetical protein KDC04_06190, partial [Saprospiraceae bacterium]|nr:hypothetical protein [Saprospiraceae bacterium]